MHFKPMLLKGQQQALSSEVFGHQKFLQIFNGMRRGGMVRALLFDSLSQVSPSHSGPQGPLFVILMSARPH